MFHTIPIEYRVISNINGAATGIKKINVFLGNITLIDFHPHVFPECFHELEFLAGR